MPAARSIKLKPEEDEQLRELEHSQGLRDKVRLRAKVLRLSHRGMSVEEIASYTGRHATSVLRDFNRWEESGVQGLADGVGSGKRSPLGEEQKSFLREKLKEERSWTASQLAEVVNEKFKLKVNRETMRVCLHGMGYSWQRHRYVPVKQPDAEVLATKQAEFDSLKKAERGDITLKYLDEVGVSLSLPLSYGWRPKGQPLRVPKHWGAAGRINLIGSLSCSKDTEQLEYQVLEERCYLTCQKLPRSLSPGGRAPNPRGGRYPRQCRLSPG